MGPQVRLELDAGQVEALKAIRMSMTDQLLNVTAERMHVSHMLQVTIQLLHRWHYSGLCRVFSCTFL